MQKYHLAASTCRNVFVNYRGGASSRAGFAYVGTCKQPTTAAPPRNITFQFNTTQGYVLEFGDEYMRIVYQGAYITEAPTTISGITKANPAVITDTAHGYSNGDWIFIQGVGGMTNFNGLTWIVTNRAANTYQLTDLFGNVVNSTSFPAYTSGGTASRIYTVVAPYAAVDLPFLKFTQSEDTMSLACVNQATDTEYPTYDLVRVSNTNWTFTQVSFASPIAAPTGITVAATSSTTVNTYYSYVVTAVDSITGGESIASSPGYVENNDIAINAGSNTITWTAVSGASYYKIYAATPSYNVQVPAGSSYGYLGTAFGTQFIDTNITADFTQVPPVHNNPFARGSITAVTITGGGSGYTQATVGFSTTTSTGSGLAGTPVIVSGAITAFIIKNSGSGYVSGDTISFTGGTGATGTLVIGPESGTYPGVVSYFQQRRVYAYTLNSPNTYFMSQPGTYTDFDSSIPVTDSDAITGTPWAQQVNGIQAFVTMPNGLLTFNGSGIWQVSGGGQGTNIAITPSNQTAVPQAQNGCHYHIAPILVNYNILYVQTKGSIVRDLSYNIYYNIYSGTDITILSNHLFDYHQLQQWAWAEEPYKLAWAVRDDGILLSLTYLKEQEINAWARHDTNGQFVSVCSVTEPPVDAIYAITKRYIQGQDKWVYYQERMDDRNWATVEDCFCVDAGLSYPMTFPNATLTPAAAQGTSNITSTNLIAGGTGYTAPIINAVDPTGVGFGATFSATVSGSVITGITVLTGGSNYAQGSTLVISDMTGTGASAQPIVTNDVVFTASSGVFNSGMVGDVIRIGNPNAITSANFNVTPNGGGKAVITAYNSSTSVTANIVEPITNIVPDDPFNTPAPVAPNQWSISVPTKTVSGLNHLEGMIVSILADGSVSPQQTVTNGSIVLPEAASAITVGLGFTAQLQTLYLDAPIQGGTMQGKRKNVYAATVRVQNSRGFSVGTNQVDASTQPNNANVPWTNLTLIKERNALVNAGSAIPLYTGDIRTLVYGSWSKPGQVAIEQDFPLPMNVLAILPEYALGDSNSG